MFLSEGAKREHALQRALRYVVECDTPKMRDLAQMVIGYVELYHHYPEGKFPWKHVAKRLKQMCESVGRARNARGRAKEESPEWPSPPLSPA